MEAEMTYAFTQDVPIDVAFHRRVMDGLGDELPEGLIMHVALERPEGGLRYLDIWDTEEDCDRFVESRLHPIIHSLLADIFGDDMPPEPERQVVAVAHIWQR
jgi:hypothetical protein